MRYRRMPIEIEGPEQFGYDAIEYNLSESSVTDVAFSEMNLDLGSLLLSYENHMGKPALRELITAGTDGLTADHVLMTVGAAAALFIIATSLLNAGDHVLVVYPNYATNIETPRQIEANIELFPLKFEQDYRLDIDAFARHIRPETRFASITIPHNPTGATITREELLRLVEIVEEKGCRLLVDETYREMGYDEVLPIAASLSPRVISVSSLSKTYGLPGIRMGWLITQDSALMETFLAAKEQIFITNSILDEEVAYQYLLDKDAHLSRIRAMIARRLEIMREWIAEEPSMEWVEPRGGVVSFPRILPTLNIDINEFYQRLVSVHKTYVGAGHWFESDRRHMRIGFGWQRSDKELREGLQRISQTLRETINA